MQGSQLKTQYCKVCIFKAKQVVFYRHLVHTNGLSSDPWKVQAILNMTVPPSKTELQSYIGMCNFLSSYVPHLTNKLFVLQQLMAKDSDFIWTVSHTKAFECSKDAILLCAMLTYYDDEKTCTIHWCWSCVDTGGQSHRVSQPCFNLHPAMLQQHKREAYTLVNGVEHFHHYIFGNSYEVHTDHQPLVQLSIKPQTSC